MGYMEEFIEGFKHIVYGLDAGVIERMADELSDLKERGGRLFILGLGGSAANASHAVNDFRKLCYIDAQAPTDNVAELTARANDDGWENCLAGWLRVHLNHNDALLVLSVGGGNDKTSLPLVRAMEYAHSLHVPVLGIVGRNGGAAKKLSKVCVLIPAVADDRITPYAEAAQAVVWHGLANHPKLRRDPLNAQVVLSLEALKQLQHESVHGTPFVGVTAGPDLEPRRRAVFLDRDGVLCKLIDGQRPPYTLPELELIPGVQDACAKFKAAGYLLICVTNQPDIARGKVSKSKVNLINQALKSTLGLDAVYTCPHDDADRCACRKPKPGLLQQAAINHHIELEHSYMIGDRAVDTQAGCAARCRASFQVGPGRYKSLLDVALAIVGTREVTA